MLQVILGRHDVLEETFHCRRQMLRISELTAGLRTGSDTNDTRGLFVSITRPPHPLLTSAWAVCRCLYLDKKLVTLGKSSSSLKHWKRKGEGGGGQFVGNLAAARRKNNSLGRESTAFRRPSPGDPAALETHRPTEIPGWTRNLRDKQM